MSNWILVQHMHTRHSFDSLTEPRWLVERAEELKIDVIAVTDHGTWRGAVEASECARDAGLKLHVIPAAEYLTDHGDVIGLFLDREYEERSAVRLCDAIHARGGLTLLPHPYRWHQLEEDLLSRMDLIEVYNSRTTDEDNKLASKLAGERGLPGLVGPDAHRMGELELARNVFEGARPANDEALKHALLHAPRRFEVASGSKWDEWISQGVKLVRRPTARGAWGLVRGAVRRIVKPKEYPNG
jgi:predicted metal-dependent phosphoesterase TrpH